MQAFRLIGIATTLAIAVPTVADDSSATELFEKRIRPALIKYCYECHADDSDDLGGGLLLDSRSGWQKGGEMGPAISPGNPDQSLLIRAIEYEDLEMPPDQKIPEEVIADFRRWVSMGAVDPRDGVSHPRDAAEEVAAEPSTVPLWSLQPIRQHDVPPIDDPSWALTDLDRFVWARLEKEGLQPNASADPATLIRRVYFDLIGLPPSPEEVEGFVDEPTQDRYATIVDRLLASPRFGERWARHWLDVARYGESAGSSRDVLMIYAWRYRDYVIEALNNDLPFDRFVTEQIAGDLLSEEAAEQGAALEEIRRLQVATGLLAIGSKSLNGGNLTYDIIDDQIDVVSKAVLGMTVSCARCHDHKFDPIPTADYYALAGIFLSTETRYGGSIRRPDDRKKRLDAYLALESASTGMDPGQVAELEKKIAAKEKQLAKAEKQIEARAKQTPAKYRKPKAARAAVKNPSDDLKPKVLQHLRDSLELLDRRDAIREDLADLKSRRGPEPDYAVGVRDQAKNKIRDAKVLLRGEKNQPQESVKRGFLSAIGPIDKLHGIDGRLLGEIDQAASGRRQLAAWLVHPDNPLTPRVATNRIWQHVMGSGIVETVDNFGVTGSSPSHPKLLDFLARRFITTHDWSVKSMIRELVLSRTYQMSSATRADAMQRDPDNRLRWRMPRRRLDAEPLRDSMLAVSGLLRTEPLDGSLVLQIGEGEVGRNLDTGVLDQPFDHRSVYLPIIRGIIPESLRLFDFPEPSNVQGGRASNTTPSQALFLMNSELVLRTARHFAVRLLEDPSLDSASQRVRQAHLLCFSAPPTDAELKRDLQYLRSFDAAGAADPMEFTWTSYCQALLGSAPFRYLD